MRNEIQRKEYFTGMRYRGRNTYRVTRTGIFLSVNIPIVILGTYLTQKLSSYIIIILTETEKISTESKK